MPTPQKYIVGRERDIEVLADFVRGNGNEFILNIFGPGGIGKTELCEAFAAFCRSQGYICAFVQMDTPDLTFDRILYNLRNSVVHHPSAESTSAKAFKEFDKFFSEYLTVKEILKEGGGIGAFFDSVGDVIPGILAKAISSVGGSISGEIKLRFRNRYALQEYVKGAEQWLTESFANSLSLVQTSIDTPFVIIIDTYEKAAYLDQWICDSLVRMLPNEVRLVISGRDRLQSMGFHWVEYTQQIRSYELSEVSKEAALDFYRHFGLVDLDLLEATYNFTGGYPLCMVLAVDLAREGGWHQIAGFERQFDKYEVARQLLDRLLEQEGVDEVREFLEKGVVTLWFDVEAIAYLLQIPTEKAEYVFEKISKFSFTTKTEFGLKFHDRIKDILTERLIFIDRKLYESLLKRWRDYYKAKVSAEWLEI